MVSNNSFHIKYDAGVDPSGEWSFYLPVGLTKINNLGFDDRAFVHQTDVKFVGPSRWLHLEETHDRRELPL